MGHSRKHPYHPNRGNWKLTPPTPFRCPNTFTIIRKNVFSPPPPDGINFPCGGSVYFFWTTQCICLYPLWTKWTIWGQLGVESCIAYVNQSSSLPQSFSLISGLLSSLWADVSQTASGVTDGLWARNLSIESKYFHFFPAPFPDFLDLSFSALYFSLNFLILLITSLRINSVIPFWFSWTYKTCLRFNNLADLNLTDCNSMFCGPETSLELQVCKHWQSRGPQNILFPSVPVNNCYQPITSGVHP